MKKLVFLLNFIILLSLTACFSSGQSFTYYIESEVTSLDPQTAIGSSASSVISSIFEGLCRIDSDGEITPGVATSYESNSDYTAFTFHLRSDATWSNGESITANDFVFALRRVVDPQTKATNLDDVFIIKNAEKVNSGELDITSLGVTAIDEKTLYIELERSYQGFVNLTTGPHFMPCNRDFFLETNGRYGLEARYLLTNGPFTFTTSGSFSDSITLEKSSSYKGEEIVKPAEIIYVSNWETEITENPTESLKNYEVDILPLDYSSSVLAASSGINVSSIQNQTVGILFNSQSEILKNKDLREIFVKTINRESLISALPDDLFSTEYIIPDNIVWNGENYRNFMQTSELPLEDYSVKENLETVLDKLNLTDAPSLTIICQDDEVSKSLANELISSWNKSLESYFNIEPLTENDFNTRISNGNYEIAIYTVSALSDSPNSFLKNFESTSVPMLLNSLEYDSLIRSYGTDIYAFHDMEKYLHENYIFYPIFKGYSYYGFSPNLRGIVLGSDYVDFISAVK